MVTPKWQPQQLELIKEACRQGELKLTAQVQMATSADQRATVLAGIYVAAATGIMGAIATSDSLRTRLPFLIASGITAIAFLVGAVLCIRATLPVNFWPPGNEPGEWYEDIEKSRPLHEAIGDQAAHFDRFIKENKAVIDRNADNFKMGALLGIAAPIFGLFVGGIICLFSSC